MHTGVVWLMKHFNLLFASTGGVAVGAVGQLLAC